MLLELGYDVGRVKVVGWRWLGGWGVVWKGGLSRSRVVVVVGVEMGLEVGVVVGVGMGVEVGLVVEVVVWMVVGVLLIGVVGGWVGDCMVEYVLVMGVRDVLIEERCGK